MPKFDTAEVDAAFRNYWQLGAVGEDWDTWCDECFTEDVTCIVYMQNRRDHPDASQPPIDFPGVPDWARGGATYAESRGATRA